MLLKKEQADALYRAMVDCNDVGATFRFGVAHDDGFLITVEEALESWGVNLTSSPA